MTWYEYDLLTQIATPKLRDIYLPFLFIINNKITILTLIIAIVNLNPFVIKKLGPQI